MPKYDFKCELCGCVVEHDWTFADYEKNKNNQSCYCGGKMSRVFTPIALTEYRCAGFFDTDNQRKSFR